MSLEIKTVLACVLMAGFIAGIGVTELAHQSREEAEFKNENDLKR